VNKRNLVVGCGRISRRLSIYLSICKLQTKNCCSSFCFLLKLPDREMATFTIGYPFMIGISISSLLPRDYPYTGLLRLFFFLYPEYNIELRV
jgi:hypothetical protein